MEAHVVHLLLACVSQMELELVLDLGYVFGLEVEVLHEVRLVRQHVAQRCNARQHTDVVDVDARTHEKEQAEHCRTHVGPLDVHVEMLVAYRQSAAELLHALRGDPGSICFFKVSILFDLFVHVHRHLHEGQQIQTQRAVLVDPSLYAVRELRNVMHSFHFVHLSGNVGKQELCDENVYTIPHLHALVVSRICLGEPVADDLIRKALVDDVVLANTQSRDLTHQRVRGLHDALAMSKATYMHVRT